MPKQRSWAPIQIVVIPHRCGLFLQHFLFSYMLFSNGDDDVCSSTLMTTLTSPLMALIVYLHLQKFSKKSSWKVNGTWLFGLLQRKISGSNRPPEMVVLFFRMESSKWKFVFHFFKPILDTSFRLSQLFLVNGTGF